MKISALLSIILFFSLSAQAEKEVIQFPDEELETETVLPVFPNRQAVKGRLIELTKRVEVGGGLGSSLNEAFYEPLIFGFNGTYYLDELQGIRFTYVMLNTGVNSNAAKLKETGIVGPGNEFDASLAPAPKSFLSVDYIYSAFYGKISLTKQVVYNTSTYFAAGLGMMDFSGSSEIGLHLGLGQKVYLNQNLAIKLDLNILSHQGPDPTNPIGGKVGMQPGNPKLPASAFSSRTYFNQMLMGGLVYLF